MQRLGWTSRPRGIHELQAGRRGRQMGLVQIYESSFRATRLAYRAGAADPCRSGRPRALPECPVNLLTLVTLDVVPIINENDTVVTDEINFGDNDTLGALVANLIEADAW